MASVNVMGYFNIKSMSGEVNLSSHTIKLMLLSSSATPNIDTHIYIEDIAGDEVSGTGYSAGGETVSPITMSYNPATNTSTIDAPDVVFSTVTISTRYGALYDSDTSVIIAYLDFDSLQSPSASDFTVSFNAAGIFTSVV